MLMADIFKDYLRAYSDIDPDDPHEPPPRIDHLPSKDDLLQKTTEGAFSCPECGCSRFTFEAQADLTINHADITHAKLEDGDPVIISIDDNGPVQYNINGLDFIQKMICEKCGRHIQHKLNDD
jgi:hypothetical protein